MKLYLIALVALVLLVTPSHGASQPTALKEAEEVIEGIFVGTFGEIGREVRGCITDGEQIFLYIEDAVKLFELGGRDNIIKGIVTIGKALALIPEEVRDCKAIEGLVADIEEIIAEFANPEALIVIIGERILWHGIDIYEDVRHSISHFKGKQFEPAGEDIGNIVKICFIGKPHADRIEDAVQFIEGFFKGALEDDSIDIEECIDDADEIIKEIETIVDDFKKGMSGDIEKLFMDILDLMAEIPKTVVKCEVSEAELAKLEEWAQLMKDFSVMEKKFFYAFLYFPDRIKKDFKDIIDSFKEEQFNTSGFCLGDLLHVLFVDVKTKKEIYKETDFDDIVEFTKGFYAKAFDIKLDLDTCDADVDAAWDALVKAVDEIKEFTVAGIEQGIEDLIMALPKFVESFKVCEADWPDLEKGLEKLKVFEENPLYVPWAVTKASTLHPIRMMEDSTELYHAFHDLPRNFEHGGEASGDIVGLVSSEMGKVDSVVQAALKN